MVATGSVLAELGETVISSPGDHLHFEVRRGPEYINPEQIIDFTR
ncbi:hypothetical protein [Oceanicoccus sp. KOV_DT_Chl]|nr:hypothetical protein [Oceanicoccus sp. KOV_DT_Chl]